MTRTAIRRHVDVSDGRLVIRKIVVETSECLDVAPASEPVSAAPLAGADGAHPRWLRRIRPGKYAVRVRRTHLL